MAVTGKLYGKLFEALFNKEVDWDTDTMKCMLCTSLYAPDQDTHKYKDVSVTNAVTGTNYTAGGATLGTKTVTYTGATNVFMLDADDAVWSNSTITARTAVVYDDTPASNKPLICYQQESADIASNNGEFRVQWNASGIVQITVS